MRIKLREIKWNIARRNPLLRSDYDSNTVKIYTVIYIYIYIYIFCKISI